MRSLVFKSLNQVISIKLRCAKYTLLTLGCLTLVSAFAGVSIVPASYSPAKSPASVSTNESDPDSMLIAVYKLLGQNQLNAAQSLADKLVATYPTFHLGYLVQGDLYRMHNAPVTTFGDVKNAPADKIKDLRDEARARIKSLSERPGPDLLPRAILQLRDDQKHAFVVDAKRSRLYVYENQSGHLKFVSDYYITQ